MQMAIAIAIALGLGFAYKERWMMSATSRVVSTPVTVITVDLGAVDQKKFFEMIESFCAAHDFRGAIRRFNPDESSFRINLTGRGMEIDGANPFKAHEFQIAFHAHGKERNSDHEIREMAEKFVKATTALGASVVGARGQPR